MAGVGGGARTFELFELLLARLHVRLSFGDALLALALGAATPPPVESDPDAASDAAHTQEEIDEAREEFESIDANKDGWITREEIMQASARLPAASRRRSSRASPTQFSPHAATPPRRHTPPP